MSLSGRSFGVFVHITSLTTHYGVGDLGPTAYHLIEILKELGSRYWQILPLHPTSDDKGNSPYSSPSTFAGNYLLISPDLLVIDGLLKEDVLRSIRTKESSKVLYKYAYRVKEKVLRKAFTEFKNNYSDWGKLFEEFKARNSFWLGDYSLFMVIKKLQNGKPWYLWPTPLKRRVKRELRSLREKYSDLVLYEEFTQFIFYLQWERLKNYANRNGISIIGDLPYYVDLDSADVWVNPHLFKLNKKLRPAYVGGVPPDYFSRTGQLWGNPVYDWDKHLESGFHWWIKRLKHASRLYDITRLDHFRGFIGYWEVPSRYRTAKHGRWVRTPYEEFFRKISAEFPTLPFIAEDLGFITPDVREVIYRLKIPGMKVLVFAFGGDSSNPHLPINYTGNEVVYTSTHDSNTVKGWFMEEAGYTAKEFLSKYSGILVNKDNVCETLIRLALSSIAPLVITPVQDLLCLGSEGRMNLPGTSRGNWEWRTTGSDIHKLSNSNVKDLAEVYGRVN